MSEHERHGEAYDAPEIIDNVRPIPRISIQAFCESDSIAQPMETAAKDRRLTKATFRVNMGGYRAALDHFSGAPTPNLVIVEMKLPPRDLVEALDRLADVCDPGSKVVVVGHYNDVQLYRELMRCGVSEYLVAPVSLADILTTISDIFVAPDAEPLGRSIAFVGAKGGVGSSTIAHNVSWAISKLFSTEVILADCDLAFGTANINFDRDPPQGIYEALISSDQMDETLLDRLLAKCSEHLSLLAAPSLLDRSYDISSDPLRVLIDIAQRSAPIVALDMPHTWTEWVQSTLAGVDQVVLTASPDLANLRNAKNMVDILAKLRPNDPSPVLVLNQLAMPKRPEIAIEEFCEPLGLTPAARIEFQPDLFGKAANGGQMIREADPKHATGDVFDHLAHVLTGRETVKVARKPGLMDRLRKRRPAAA